MSSGKDKLYCTACGKEKYNRDFYTSFSPFHNATNRLHVCKSCVNGSVIDGDVKSFMNMLRSFDKPFIPRLYESALQVNSYIGEYFKLINAKDFKFKTWEDSEFEGHVKAKNINSEDQNYELDDETIKYWGRGHEDWVYDFLENEMMKLQSSFECPDYGMEMIMKDISFINLDIERLRQENKESNAKAIMNLIETRSKLMNAANMNPIQATGAEANDQITFGTLIKKWENDRPIPKPLDDEMKEYIDTYMVGHLAKMEGIQNELTDKYEKAISKYTIKFEEINKEEEYDD